MAALVHSFPLEPEYFDVYGHMNHIAYFELFEKTRWAIGAANGYSKADVHAGKVGPIVLRLTAKFVREIRPEDQIRITTERLSASRRMLTIRQTLWKDAGELSCEVEVTMGLFDTGTRRLTALTDRFINAFPPLSAL